MKRIFLGVVLAIVICCIGCMQHINGASETSHSNFSVNGITTDPQKAAAALSLLVKKDSEAAINYEIANKIKDGNGNFAVNNNYTGVILNDNSETAYVRYPYSSRIIEIASGERYILMTPEIPEIIYAKFGQDENFLEHEIFKETRPFDGLIIHYGARIY